MKKVLSLVLTVVLVMGLSAVAFAAPPAPTGIIEAGDTSVVDVTLGISGSLPKGTVTPEYKAYFNVLHNGNYLTRSQVRALKLDVQIRATEGSAAIDTAAVVYKTLVSGGEKVAVVELKFVKEFVSTKDLDFAIDLYLTEKKSRLSGADQVASIDGTFGNDVQYVNEGSDYVFIGDSPVVEAEDYIREIQVDLGQGVSIYTKMFADKKYYGSVSQEIKSEDEALLAKYADIETVYYLKTINLTSTGNIVAFDLDNNLYAYAQDPDSGELIFIGRTNDRLPYFQKYFLSSKELDIEEIEIGDEDDIVEPGDETGPVIGGDDEAPANVNDNPSTGR